MNCALILLGVVACAFGNTDEQVCIRRFTDSDTVFPYYELMNAFYIADPDPRTGYVTFTSRGNISLSRVTLPYDPWLKRQHDGKDHFQNLWVYVTRLIASGIDELYLHYSSVKRYTSTRPRVPIEFHKLKTIFSDVCGTYETYKSSWPFFCFDSNFFCAFNQSLETLDNIFANKTTWEILAMSKITVDNDDRNKAIIGMFHNDIIKDFSTDVQYRPLYRSSLITKCVEMLVSPDDRTNNWINNSMLRLLPKIELACSINTNNRIGKAYYCPAKYYIIKTIECFNTKNGSNCIYLSIFQEYFENGRFLTPSEKRILGYMKSITETFINNMVSAIVRKHDDTMNNLMDSIHQFLDVDPSSCTYRQSKTFDCGTDERCKISTMYRSDCIVLFLVKSAKNFLLIKESQTKSEAEMMKVKRFLNILLFYPPYVYDSTLPRHEIDESIVTFHKEVDDLRNKFEIAGFEKLSKFFPPENFLPARVERDECSRETISNLYKPFCLVSPLVDSIQQFIRSVRNSQNAKIRVLNPFVDYTSLLSQLQLSQVSSFLNKQAQTYFNILSRKIDEIPNYLQENFDSIGNYFTSLAVYDSKKSTADILYINGALKKFKTQLDSKATELAEKIKLLFGLAIGSTSTESLSRIAMFSVEVARNFNPLLHLFGGSDPNSLADRINDMTKSVVAVTKVIQIGVRVIPEIAARAKKITDGLQ